MKHEWLMLAKHPRLWKGWKILISYSGIAKQEAIEKAKIDHTCYEGVKTYKVVAATSNEGLQKVKTPIEKIIKLKEKESAVVYILKCNDGSYYTGWTNNMPARIKKHNSGKGAKYCRGNRLPVEIAFMRTMSNQSLAMHAEHVVKCLTHHEKYQLIHHAGKVPRHLLTGQHTQLARVIQMFWPHGD